MGFMDEIKKIIHPYDDEDYDYEDEELEQAYRKMSNSRKIAESLAESYQLSGNDAEDGAGNSLSRALRALRSVTMYDPALEQMEEQLAEVESLLSD